VSLKLNLADFVKIICVPKEGSRFVKTVYIDGEPFRDIHCKIFGKSPVFPEEMEREKFQLYFLSQEFTKAKKYTLDCLALRSYPSKQLEKLLERHLISTDTIQKILADCIRLGYLNDEAWMESFVRGQLARRISPQMIIFKLMQKGIPKKTAQEQVGLFSDQIQVSESITHLLKTKYKNKNLKDFKEKQKVFGALMRRGFSPEDIKQALQTEIDFLDDYDME